MPLNSDPNPIPNKHTDQQVPRDKNLDILLTRVKEFGVEGVLEKSLHNEVLIELDKVGRPDAVAHPWDTTLALPDHLPQRIPPDKKIDVVFEEAGRNLLILGAPGSGKTITMLELARALIEKAEQDDGQPVPVIFNLSSWSMQQTSLLDWLIYEFKIKYNIPKRFCEPWLLKNKLVLLLDGLDEVGDAYQEECLHQINLFLEEYGTAGLVLCSRSEEYEALFEQARLGGAVHIEPLRKEQIKAYVAQGGDELNALEKMLDADEEMVELATSPLMLNVMSMAYLGADEQDVDGQTPASSESLRTRIFDRYIQTMVDRKGGADKPYTLEETKRHLGWLASKMRAHGKTVFHLEELQGSWLGGWLSRFSYSVTSRILGGLGIGLFWSIIAVILASIFLADFEENNPDYRTSWQAYYDDFLDATRTSFPGMEEAIQENPDITVAKFPPMDLRSINSYVFFVFLFGSLFAGFVIGVIDGFASEFLGYFYKFRQQRTSLYVVVYLVCSLFVGLILISTVSSIAPYLFSIPALGGLELFMRQGVTMLPRFDYIAYIYLGIAAMMVFMCYNLVYSIFWAMRSIRADPGGDIKVVEKLNWSREGIKAGGLKGLRVGFFVSLIIYMLGALYMGVMYFIGSQLAGTTSDPNAPGVFGVVSMFFLFALLGAVVTGLMLGVNTAVFGGLQSAIFEGKSKPNQGITLSAKNAFLGSLKVWLVASLTSGLFVGMITVVVALLSGTTDMGTHVLAYSLASGFNGFWIAAVVAGALFGVFLFPFAVLWFGGQDVIQHYVLQALLRFQRKIPSGFVNFLDYAADVILLRKVGGGYIFIHRMLLEHFAKAYEETTA